MQSMIAILDDQQIAISPIFICFPLSPISSMLRIVVGREAVPYRNSDDKFEESAPASQSTLLNNGTSPSKYGTAY